MIRLESRGDFRNLEKFLTRMSQGEVFKTLDRHGQAGVDALSMATPRDSGSAASSWSYEVVKTKRTYSISWTNSDMAGGVPVVILLQYGHGTGTGGYVQGRDFINPALKPIFDKIANEVWKAVTSA